MIIWFDPRSIILLAVPTAVVFVAYRAYIREREKHERLELLYASSRLLHYAPELEFGDRRLLEHARRMFRAERAELMLFPEPSLDAALRRPRAAQTARETIYQSPSPPDDALRVRTPAKRGRSAPSPVGHGRRSWVEVEEAMIGPLVGEHGVFGALTIINRLGEGTSFEPDDLRLLETVANQAAVALENGQLEQSLHELSRLKEELRHQAFHDSLTGLPNRPAFVDEVELRDVPWRRRTSHRSSRSSTSMTSRSSTTRWVSCRRRAADRRWPNGSPSSVAAGRRGRPFRRRRVRAAARSAARRSRRRWPSRERIMHLAASCRSDPRHARSSSAAAPASPAARPGAERQRGAARADVAMYHAKADGKRRAQVFEPTMHSSIVERHALTSELRPSRRAAAT